MHIIGENILRLKKLGEILAPLHLAAVWEKIKLNISAPKPFYVTLNSPSETISISSSGPLGEKLKPC